MSAPDLPIISLALKTAGFDAAVEASRSLTGGCIHRVFALTLHDGHQLVIKINHARDRRLFDEEAQSLHALAATQSVLVPQPLSCVSDEHHAALLMPLFQPAPAAADKHTWKKFGEELALLHAAELGQRYGFHADNHIGTTFQPNSWHDDWVEFNRVNRLGFQLHTAIESNALEPEQAKLLESVVARLDRLIPARPKASLLHGDLWSGNVLPVQAKQATRIAVIDPACSIGDGWADIAMMKLFGGFPQSCFDGYCQARSEPCTDEITTRIRVYQLYHVLNHVNIFGSGYIAQAMSLARQLV
jgi:protein-ribulosamine 3-kinase